MKSERALQEKELSILNRRLKQIEKATKRQWRFLFIWVILAAIVGIIVYNRLTKQEDRYLLFVTLAVYIGIGVWVVMEQRVKQSKEKKGIEYLKSKNLVTVIEVNSAIYYELKEEDDEGVYYLFQLDENSVLSFGGQEFYEDENFPSNKFEIVEGRGINGEVLILEVFVSGERIKPSKVITGKEKWDLLQSDLYPDPEKLTIATGRIEDYITRV